MARDDPVLKLAYDLVQAGEALFWKKRYDEGIRKLEEAAALDREYVPKVEAYRKLKERQIKKGRVNLSRAMNRILFPRLHRLGFRVRWAEESAVWKDGYTLVRTSPTGREAFVMMGREKFGKAFGLNVSRDTRSGEWESLDPKTVGLDGAALEYLNQAEADRVLERVAAAFEGPILGWLDEPEPA